MLYLAYRIGFFLTAHLPLKVCYLIAGWTARIFFLFSVQDKKELKENLKIVLGEGTDNKTLDKLVFKVFRNFSKYLADFFRFRKFTSEYIDSNVNIIGKKDFDECLSEGKGLVLVSLHLGNWELGGAVIGSLGYPISGIVLTHADKKVNDFFVRQRALNGFKSIPIGSKMKECFRALSRNEVVGVVGDKVYTSVGVPITFFGKKAIMPRGPAALALRTGAQVVFCSGIRKTDDTFDFVFERPDKSIITGDPKVDEESIMKNYIKIFEKYIRKYPDQWYAFRRIWPQEQKTQ
ncbi:MAG: lysophospholipid acyltransferase family protein [Candidatus Aadella gelida]|nr:lysophospholipid acyltransferase family protein [Candidatus Aadella gelida]